MYAFFGDSVKEDKAGIKMERVEGHLGFDSSL